jgi:Type II secretory pathway, component PulF
VASGTTFAFRAIDLAGASSHGEIEAASKSQVSEQLRQRGLIVLDVSKKHSPLNVEDFFERWQSVDVRELAVFARQFATLSSSGMPMLQTLKTLQEQSEDKLLKEAVGDIYDDVEAGSSLEQAMERHPKVFDRLMRSMVGSGEQSGRLDGALDRIAYHLEKMDALRRQVKSAMMYPSFIFGFAILALLAVVIFIIPVFVGVFNELAAENTGVSAELPLPTQICVSVSGALTGYWFIVFPGLLVLAWGFIHWKKTDRGRNVWDHVKLRIPAKIGDVVQKVALARWSRTFSDAISSGIPMLQAIKLTGETSGNVVVEKAMEEVYASVKRGGSIAGPIAGNAIFPAMVSHMVAVGEETGQLEHMLTKVADFYETEVDAKVKALTALIEPLLIAFVGGVVGFIVIAMYLPIFSIYENIR